MGADERGSSQLLASRSTASSGSLQSRTRYAAQNAFCHAAANLHLDETQDAGAEPRDGLVERGCKNQQCLEFRALETTREETSRLDLTMHCP